MHAREIDPVPDEGNVLIRLPTLVRATGLGRTSIYRGIKAGTFPAPRKLGKRASAWLWRDVKTWIDGRPTGSQQVM